MDRKMVLVAIVIIAVAALFFLVPRLSQLPGGTTAVIGPNINLAKGRALFKKNCVECHGPGAQGGDKGPPLVHRYYEPNHHSDAAFYLAVQRGARQHHWNFGDMKPVPGVSRAEVALIIGYVRNLQKKAGVF